MEVMGQGDAFGPEGVRVNRLTPVRARVIAAAPPPEMPRETVRSVRLPATFRPRVTPHTAENDPRRPRSLRDGFVLARIAALRVGAPLAPPWRPGPLESRSRRLCVSALIRRHRLSSGLRASV